MNDLPGTPTVAPLDEHPAFRDWMSFVRARKEVGDLQDKRAIEAQKLSSEFSKLIITNLQFINAGGLGAVPTLAGTLLGFGGLGREDKLFYLGTPMGLFALGLMLATFCSFQTYRNFASAAVSYEWERNRLIFDLESVTPLFGPDHPEIAKAKMTDCEAQKGRADGRVKRSFWYSYLAGWGSMLCFIGACAFLAANVK